MQVRPVLFGASDGVLRQTIGFRKEVVEEPAEQELFPVTGGALVAPTKEYAHDYTEPTLRAPRAYVRRSLVR